MGYVRDIASRVSRARQYLGRKIRAARRFIYEQAFGIGSEKVNGLLKETSSVPTLVRTVLALFSQTDSA
jgi:hypothetical protein